MSLTHTPPSQNSFVTGTVWGSNASERARDSLETLLGFDEFEYLALFLWLAIAGPGVVSIDAWLQRWYDRAGGRSAAATRSGQAWV